MKPFPLVGAVLLAVFLVVRRRRLEPTLLVGGTLAVVALLVYGSGLVEFPNAKTLVEDAGTTLGRWTYLVVGAMAFFETGAFVGLIAPGETFLIFGGVVAGQGTISLVALIAIVWVCAVGGDLVSFYAGRRLGRAFLVRHGPKVQITPERIESVEAFFERHGGKAILLGRFVGLIRAVNPFLAGSSGMQLRRFLPYSVVGAGAWAAMLLTLGYIFWASFDQVLDYAERGTLALGTTIVVVVAAIWAYRRLREPEQRRAAAAWIEATLDRPALRPLRAVLLPIWRHTGRARRFVWHRLTPGDLGLELTTLLAVAAVGAFAFVGAAVEIHDGSLVRGDRGAADAAHDLRTGWLTSVAKGVTLLGTSTVVGLAVAVTCAVLAAGRRLAESVALLAGSLVTYAAVHEGKAATDRPRPSGALVDVAGSSYPSAHAAYAGAWVAIAVVLARTVPGLGRTAVTVLVGLVAAVLVALTRVYLRAHYLSDVVGGLGLSLAVFAVAGMVALVVVHVRHNAHPP